MIYTYKELLNIYRNERQINNALKEGKIHRVSKGIYSTIIKNESLETISKRYPRAVVTGQSAFYYYGLTTDPGQKYTIAAKYNGTRISNPLVEVQYQQERLLNIGAKLVDNIHIYNKERLLIELFRNKNKFLPDIFKEVVNSYRNISNELYGSLIEEYASFFTNKEKLLNDIFSIIF